MGPELIVDTGAETADRAPALGDAELVAAINAGNHAAFETLYHRHRDWTVNLAFRFTGDEALALDVMQETFLYLLRKFPGFELRAQLRTFLYPAVRNLAIAARIMDDFIGRIRHPALTDLRLDWGGAAVTDVFPQRVPDVFVGRPVVLCGRFRSGDLGEVRISGETGGQRTAWSVSGINAEPHRGLPSVWARMKIADLSDRALLDRSADLAGRIKQTALDFGLMSEFTAFVAVDSSRVTEGRVGTTVPVAVPVPDGVKYETTVPEQ